MEWESPILYWRLITENATGIPVHKQHIFHEDIELGDHDETWAWYVNALCS